MTPRVDDYEKLGAFYLGRQWSPERGDLDEEILLYDAKDLTTHAVCVGMTGSGKTGLCVGLIEEAAIDGIPAIVVDLKGDLPNLLLGFPKLRPEDFLPWVDASEATRKGMSKEEYARNRAELWKKGLGKWGQDGSRIKKMQDKVDFSVYTPGSDAGRPVAILRSLAAPPEAIRNDNEAMNDRVQGATSGLLALLGVDADPLRSREHILISNILDSAWREGRDLDLPALIRAVQSPGFTSIGIFDLETFFPANDRLGLAMTINNLLASPGFKTWIEGESLDIGRLLWNDKGKPQISIISIAHLSDAERMFFLTVLFNEVLAWTRTQPGSSSLRALMYVDEVFGYLPPTANPPTKKPLLTLLKQARAFGFGCILATQNPVDLDYKALSNAGTWFLGRLQTERDKLRVLEGLEGAAQTTGARFDRGEMDRILSGLKSRVFVMNNAHENGPVAFHTRWAMSYLAGPMTREQIRALDFERPSLQKAPPKVVSKKAAPKIKSRAAAPSPRPILPAGVDEAFLPASEHPDEGEEIVYRPGLAATARIHFSNATAGVDVWRSFDAIAPLDDDGGQPWDQSSLLTAESLAFDDEGEDEARFADLPSKAKRKTSFTSWSKGLAAHLYRERSLATFRAASYRLRSKGEEGEGNFRARVEAVAREKRDREVEKLRRRYEKKLTTLNDRQRRAEDKVEREEAQYSQAKSSTVISFGKTLLGALFGRKLTSRGNIGGAATTMRGAGRASKEKGDIARAKDEVAAVQAKLLELEEQFREDISDAEERFAVEDVEITESLLRPRKSDTEITNFQLVWMPWIRGARGKTRPAFEVSDEI